MDTQVQRLVAGRYRLLARLGEGGMGTVWRSRDELLGREVAVKEVTFPAGLSEDEREVLRERTRREGRAAARLDHPSAVTVFDVVEEDGLPYLVMELVEAQTLAELVRRDGPLSPQRTAEVGLALLGALETAHGQGVVHRDVKPSNVMVKGDGRVVLTDFGIATSTGDPSITHTGMLLGSPAYIAPERVRGQAHGPASDLWSLGATLFTAVEGVPPFAGDEPLVTVVAVTTGEHVPFTRAGPLEPLLEGLLTKDPEQRLDAAAARDLLERAAAAPPEPATRPVTAPLVSPAAGRTAALDLQDVREEVAAAEPAAPPAPAPAPAPAAARAPAPLPRPPRRPPPPPAARRGRPGWAVPAAAGVVLVAVAGGAVALATGQDRDGTTASPTTSRAPSVAPSPEPSAVEPSPVEPEPSPAEPQPSPSPAPAESPAAAAPATEPDPAAAGVPAGWSTDTGSAGWTVALPPGYVQTRAGEYRDADTGRTLRVETGEGQPDAVADRERAAASFAERYPSYDEIRIEAADYRGYEAADWEFTYEGLHVLNRVFVVDGTGHSLFFQTRRADFPDAVSDFEGIAAGFRPVGG